MIVLQAQNLTKSFGERVLFSDVSFSMQERDRLGLTGVNGCGKTTLMRMLCGQEGYDSGDISLQKGLRLGYLSQHAQYDPQRSLYEETLTVFAALMQDEAELSRIEGQISAQAPGWEDLVRRQAHLHERYQANGGLTYRARTRSALLGMGFTDADLALPMRALSGGQLSKAQMAKLLLSGAEVLLLDEPTNHLDIQSVEWLEGYLLSYPGALLIISHDRYFLDRVTTGTLEMENGHLRSFTGNYSAYLQHKAREREIEARHYANAQKEIARMEEMIAQFRRWNRERSIRAAESKEKQLEKLRAATVRPENAPPAIRFQLEARDTGGQDVLIAEHLEKRYDKLLFRDVNLHIRRGERVFLLGPNGCGKTTLFQILLGKLQPDAGTVQLGSQIRPGYYDQHQSSLRMESTPLEEICSAFPALNQTQARSALAAFLFRGEDVFKPIASLSGGERARVELLKLMLGKANFLLLDEPTNHLDAASREALESALLDYEGTIFAISHDRYLVNRLATRVLLLTPHGVEESIGNYDDFLSHMAQRAAAQQAQPDVHAPKAPTASKERRESAAALRRMRAQLRKVEEQVDALEAEIGTLEQQLSLPDVASDYEQTLSLTQTIADKRQQLEAAMEQWESLSLSLEQYDA